MKKIIALILTLAMCICLAVAATAKTYDVSDWAEDANEALELTWSEDPTKNVEKGKFMFAILRMIQSSLERRDKPLLESDTSLEFKDADDLSSDEEKEASILVDLDVLSGYKGYMSLENDVTRAEAAKILFFFNTELELETIRKAPNFDDIKGHWAEDKIKYAYKIGMVNGKGDKMFDPEGNLTIQELMQIMINITEANSDFTAHDVATALVLTFDAETDLGIMGSYDSDSTIYLNVGEKFKYTTKSKSYWATSNSSVASVSSTGEITAKSEGTAIISNGNNVVLTIIVGNITNYITLGDKVSLSEVTSSSWKSSNTKVATVDKYGDVTAVSKGSAKIYRGTLESHNVTVVEESIIEMKQDETITLGNLKYKWSSSDEDVVSVSSKGLVTAEKSGTATVSNKYASYFIVVLPTSEITMNIGDTLKFDTTFTSSNTSVASVSSNGAVTALKKGNAILTSENHTINLKVGDYSDFVRNYTIEVGHTKTLENGKYDSSWSSEDTKIATVDRYGKVTAKKIGKVLIYNDESEYLITVVAKTEIEEFDVAVGETLLLEKGYLNESWESENTKIATVSNYGLVYAKKIGIVTIFNDENEYIINVVENEDSGNSNNNDNNDNNDSGITTKVYVEGFEPSTYYNAWVDDTVKIVVESDNGELENVEISNSKCKLTKNITSLGTDKYTFTVNAVSVGACILTLEFEDGETIEFTINSYKE